MANVQNLPPSPGFLEPTVETLNEYIRGFPAYIAITVQPEPETAFPGAPAAHFLALRGCIGLILARTRDGVIVRRVRPAGTVDPDHGFGGVFFPPDEPRRMLVDVSPLLGSELEVGDYIATFSYVLEEADYPAAPVAIHLREPTDAERDLLGMHASDRLQFPNWALWTLGPPQIPILKATITRDNPLKFGLIVRQLFYGLDSPQSIDLSILDTLDGLYVPEALALRAELLEIRGDQLGFQALRRKILTQYPGLTWWVRMIDEGGGYVRALRHEP